MKIKGNMIPVEHRKLHWFGDTVINTLNFEKKDFATHAVVYFARGIFFKSKVQFIGVFKTELNICDGAFLRK